jgi:hypothetical protein
MEVARLLRALAEEVERGSARIDGHVFEVSSSLRAVVECPDDAADEISQFDVHLWHPGQQAWEPKEMRIAMSHPGD